MFLHVIDDLANGVVDRERSVFGEVARGGEGLDFVHRFEASFPGFFEECIQEDDFVGETFKQNTLRLGDNVRAERRKE